MMASFSRRYAGAAGLVLISWASCAAFPSESQSEPATAPKPQPAASAQLTDEQRGDISMARKEYDVAIDFYERALRQAESRRADLWNKMGIAYQQESDYGHARKCYKKAIRLRKDFASAWNNLGTTYYLRSNAKKSIKYYKRAVRLDPKKASLRMNLGTAYYARKKYHQAFDEYHAALLIDPNVLSEHSRTSSVVGATKADAQYYFYVAKAFASIGRAAEAVRYLEHAMEEGFTNFRMIKTDPDFHKIENDPAYVELLKNPPVAIKD
jgi:tetratricopeptide (TPR) repeat protein